MLSHFDNHNHVMGQAFFLLSYRCRNYISERQGKSTTHDLTGRSCNLKSCSHSLKLKIPLSLGFNIPGIPGLLPGLTQAKQFESLPFLGSMSPENFPSPQFLLRGNAIPHIPALSPLSDQGTWGGGRGTSTSFSGLPGISDVIIPFFSSSVQF